MRSSALLLLAALVAVLPAGAAAGSGSPASAHAGLRLVNYYPADNAWTYMWTRWRPASIGRDLDRVRALRANTVRLIVAPRTFGYPEPRRPYTDRLSAAVRMASTRGLRVQLTLFDWWSDYRDLDGSRRWAEALLAPYAGDGRIAFVELQNEVHTDDATALAWARALVPHVRAVSRRPVALSPLGDPADGVRALGQALGDARPDLYSVHWFGRPELARASLADAVAAASGVPVIVGETGYSTHPENRLVSGMPRTRAAREAAQEHYFRILARTTRALGLPPPAPWALFDFTARGIPQGGPSGPVERRYGLFRVDGTAKAAAGTVRGAFARGVAGTFNGGFERAAGNAAAAWRVHGAANARARRDGLVRRSGRASVRLASVGGRPTGAAAVSVVPPDAPAAGAAYVAAAWGRGTGAIGSSRLVLAFFDRDDRELARATSPLLETNRGWRRLRVTATAPADSAYARVRLESTGSRGAVWFDDVVFARGR